MVVATPETAAFDVVRFFSAAGHWNNVAMVLSELAEKIDRDRLVDIAPHVHLPDVQRLGYLLSIVGEGELAEPLASWLAGRRTTIVTEIQRHWRFLGQGKSQPRRRHVLLAFS